MLANHLKTAFRSLQKYRAISLINVFGLAVGIACCILIFLFVQNETSFDKLHTRGDHIYRVNKIVALDSGGAEHHALTPGKMGPALERDYREIEHAVRLRPWWGDMLFTSDEKSFQIRHAVFADSSFFEVFDFELIRGAPGSVLAAPLSVVLSEKTAQRLFGDADPMGQVIEAVHGMPLTVTGIARSAPDNSHIQYDALISWSTSLQPEYADKFDWMDRWITQSIFTYVLLTSAEQRADVEAKFPSFMERYMARWQDDYELYLQPMHDIHLYSGHIRHGVNWKQGNARYVIVMSAVALAILLIACFNFMNLATARASKRAREVGMRKVCGADRSQLIRQFLVESTMMGMIAMVLALALVELMLPVFNGFTDKTLALDLIRNGPLWWGILTIMLIIGLVSGSYPAFVLSAFQPAAVLKGNHMSGIRGGAARKMLVVLQFTASIILFAGTAVVYKQMHFMSTKDLGFDKDQIITLKISNTDVKPRYETFRTQLLTHSNILQVTASDAKPGGSMMSYDFLPEGVPEDDSRTVPMIAVSDNFLETYAMELVDGRTFSDLMATDQYTVLINQTLANQLGWDSPVGKRVFAGTGDEAGRTVIGVVKDFHMGSLHRDVEPVLLYPSEERAWHVAARIRPTDISSTLEFLRTTWGEFDGKHPFAFSFLDDDFAAFYESERRLMQLLGAFSLLAIVIASMGLLGLSAFTIETRIKEIGVRKVLGASVSDIVLLLSKEFAKLVVIAALIASPVTYLLMNRWLQDFAYRVDVGIALFIVAGFAALTIALATVSVQALRAALVNPVNSLRYE